MGLNLYITPYRPIELWPESLPAKMRKKISKVLNSFDCIVVQAKIFANDLVKLGYNGKIEIIPYVSVKEATINPFPDFSCIRISFIGRLERAKNLDYLLSSKIFLNGSKTITEKD